MEKMKKTTIAIINWNGIRWLKKTLPKIIEYSKEANIVLIDNNSCDKSISFTKKNFKKIKIIKHKNNYGFAKGYNKAIKEIKSKYILLLNNENSFSASSFISVSILISFSISLIFKK